MRLSLTTQRVASKKPIHYPPTLPSVRTSVTIDQTLAALQQHRTAIKSPRFPPNHPAARTQRLRCRPPSPLVGRGRAQGERLIDQIVRQQLRTLKTPLGGVDNVLSSVESEKEGQSRGRPYKLSAAPPRTQNWSASICPRRTPGSTPPARTQ